jgi:PAS domain S-box-containing protein
MRPRLTSMTAGLALGIMAAASIASAAGGYLYSLRHTQTLLDTARRGALAQAELIRGALEHAMLEDDHTLIGGMVSTFGNEPGVANVWLLDRHGDVRYAGRDGSAPGDLSAGSVTCQACHQHPPGSRESSRVIDVAGGQMLRTVVPIRNRPECHTCHDGGQSINGVLIADLDTAEIQATATRDLRWMVGVTAGTTLLLVAAIGMVVRLLVLRRLQRFETTARQIAQGDLDRRIPTSGSDTIAWLAREFNTMADSVSALVVQVQAERERLETIINSIDDGIVVLDAQRRVVAANTAFLARTGAAREDLLGCSCRGDGAACTIADCPTTACLRSARPQVRICERRRPDGSVVWEEVHASPVTRMADGVHVVEVWRDISARRAAEARLAESHRLASLGLLASGFSHELNTPLGTALACVEGIGREMDARVDHEPDWTYVQETATVAREQVLRCRGVTQQFLRLSRGERLVAQVVDVHESVAAAIRLVAPTARARSVSIAMHADAPVRPRVRLEESELQHVLINLLLNAVQASAPGDAVQVSIAVDATRHVLVGVSDHGCGIAPEDHARIFEPFVSMRPGGTGLGLFLSLNFVRSWGGDIVVHSIVGQGSTFSVALPSLGGSVESIPA